MLHEFVVQVPTEKLDQSIEALNIAGLYYLYYEPSIEIKKVKNGYAYEEIQQKTTDIRIFAEENEVSNLPDAYFLLIQNALHVSKDQIQHQTIENMVWDQAFKDIDLGNNWVLCYSGANDKYVNKHLLRFEPQAAFGTGLHETTQDCLRMILDRDLTGMSILDLGTGSGMLSVAAALKQASNIVAIDYEPVTREVMHNIKLNNISTPIDVFQADLITGEYEIKGSYDWIFINIGADETIKIVDRHELLQKGHNFIISGVVDWNQEEILAMFKEAGFTIRDKRQSNEWLSYYFHRKEQS